MEAIRNSYKILIGKPARGRGGGLRHRCGIILKWILEKYIVKVGTRLN
jgi:hypothetical protein